VGLLKKTIDKITGSTPQTNGFGIWREGCGYNVNCKYEVVYQQGTYTGSDDQWREIGIPHHIIDMINKECPSKFGWRFDVKNDTKYAIISFDDRDYAFWFNLKHTKGQK